MKPRGGWANIFCDMENPFICQGDIKVAKQRGLMKLEMKKNQLKFFPFTIFLESQAFNKQMINSSDVERSMSGFTLNWFLEDNEGNQVTEKLPPRQNDWKLNVPTPRYEQPFFAEMVQLAQHLRLQNSTKEEILEKVIFGKERHIKMAKLDGMCSKEQVTPENQYKIFSKLVSNVNMNEINAPSSNEDIKTGFDLFHAIVYCPVRVIELSKFVDHLLSSESTRTTIQAADLF